MDFMNANRTMRVSDLPYSPDSASSEFFLFGGVKRQPSGCFFDDADGLLTAVQVILHGIEKPGLIKVFDKWVRRLE
jgi:hypothetical protein